ncbi:MAG: multiheme c-type cytochrome, partial [Alphaproteobacteria bacterium]
ELLTDETETEETPSETVEDEPEPSAGEAHEALFLEDRYPSANTCATCHVKQYREWSVSQHAYAQLSPVYMALQIAINQLTSGTNGDFCIRCHNQVGMNLGESVYVSNLQRHPTSREGITCVVCHRVNQNYGKVSGRLALQEGDLLSPIYGPRGDEELRRILSRPEEYRVVTERGVAGRAIHTKVEKFFVLSTPGFCGTCHDVTLLNGFRLEEAFAEFKRTEAARDGVTCQDCHMGKVQGVNAGYEEGPAAIVGGVPTKPRKLTNHFFAGPDYPIIHPGIFPHNVRAAEFKTLAEWLQFDFEAGWGTDDFEDDIPEGYEFPAAWQSIDDRYDAREILDEQFERMAWARAKRLEVLRNGFHIGGIAVDRIDRDAIEMSVEVRNATNGHGVPTGFDAERLIYLEVKVTDRDGSLVYVSGDRDPNGDVRDTHSLYVHNGELPIDEDLFSLQTKFVVRLVRGGEREQVLAVNESVSALPFVRPERRPTTLYGRPLGVRKHKQTIEPSGSRFARYVVDGSRLTGRGPYDVSVKLISQMVPVNLIAAIQGAGFDYGMSPKEIADAVVAGSLVVWERRLKIDVETGTFEEVAPTPVDQS